MANTSQYGFPLCVQDVKVDFYRA